MSVPEPYPTRAEAFAAYAEHGNRGKVKLYGDLGVDVVMGERLGPRFTDAYSGRRIWDCHCNGGVFNLGHRAPAVLAALRSGLDSLDIGNHHLISGHRARLMERLAATTGGVLPGVVLGVSGSEVNDLAVKLARSRDGRRTVVSVAGAYHGNTGLALAASDDEYRAPFHAALPDFVQVPFDDLDALAAVVDERTAAVLVEPIPATLGMRPPSPGYLQGVERLCRAAGALLVLDEVQTGLGRTGAVWAYQHEGISPDVVVTGKGLSGGVYPISAALLSAELQAFFDDRPLAQISTYGGSELGCLVALAVLDVVVEPAFLARVRALGERFAAGFADAPFRLQGRGLFTALRFPNDGDGLTAMLRLFEAGVLAVYANADLSAVQFLPPLVLRDEEADEIIATVRGALG